MKKKMIEKQKQKPVEEKPVEEKPKEKENIKPKKKKLIKKVIYQEASSSDSDGAKQHKPLKQIQPEPEPEPEPQPKPQINNNNSYSNLLYESSIDQLKSRMMEDRARFLVQSVMPSYG